MQGHITSVNLGARRTIAVDVLFAHPKLLTSSLPGFDDAFVDAVLGRDETMLIGGSEDPTTRSRAQQSSRPVTIRALRVVAVSSRVAQRRDALREVWLQLLDSNQRPGG